MKFKQWWYKMMLKLGIKKENKGMIKFKAKRKKIKMG